MGVGGGVAITMVEEDQEAMTGIIGSEGIDKRAMDIGAKDRGADHREEKEDMVNKVRATIEVVRQEAIAEITLLAGTWEALQGGKGREKKRRGREKEKDRKVKMGPIGPTTDRHVHEIINKHNNMTFAHLRLEYDLYDLSKE